MEDEHNGYACMRPPLENLSHDELAESISYLISHREWLRDEQIERLQHETQKLLDKLRSAKQAMLEEELECFKETLALHRYLLRNQ